jgi:hypothetical protein
MRMDGRTDGQTDMKLIVAFRNSAKSAKYWGITENKKKCCKSVTRDSDII